jgi:regulator of sirC expression with transglutaminase-like and TPR domain
MDYKAWRLYFEQVTLQPEVRLPLAEAALILASDEYPELDLPRYLGLIESMANTVASQFGEGQPPEDVVATLNRYLFEELQFQGNRENYYDPRNSYLNDVLERRMGLPISLSVVYIALARHLGLPIHGVSLPGHFIVKWNDGRDEILIDPFNGGRILDREGAEALVRATFNSRARLDPAWLAPVGARHILARMLTNLKSIFLTDNNLQRAWQALDKLLLLEPRSADNIRDMGLLSVKLGAYRTAAAYLEEYLLAHPDAPDSSQLRLYLRLAVKAVERLN